MKNCLYNSPARGHSDLTHNGNTVMTNCTCDRPVRRVGARRIGRWEVRRTPVRRYAANFFQETTMTPDCQKNTDGCGLFFVEPAAPCEKKTIKCDCGTDLFFGGIAQGGLEGDRLEPGKPGWSGQTGAGGAAAKGIFSRALTLNQSKSLLDHESPNSTRITA